MTRKRYTPSPPIERYAIDAGIRRAHQLRSQYLAALLTGLVKKIVRWEPPPCTPPPPSRVARLFVEGHRHPARPD